MGILDFIFGGSEPAEAEPPKQTAVMERSKGRPDRIPNTGPLAIYAEEPGRKWEGMYSDDEAVDMNYSGYIQKPVDLQNPPQAPTAYAVPTFRKTLDMMENDMLPSQKEWNKFLKRNKQRMSRRDATNLIHSDLLANKSAAIADARRLYGDQVIRTGPLGTRAAIGSTSITGPVMWAGDEPSVMRNSKQGMSTVDHELMHRYMMNLKPEDKQFLQMLDPSNDAGAAHHDVINEMDRRYHDYEDQSFGKSKQTNDLLDWIERNAEQRLGEHYRKKGFYGPK